MQVGDEVEVMVLDVDEERRRISLGIKQTQANPWEAFAAIHKKNDRVSGQDLKSITDFGIFIGLDGGIDGLVHLSDISWQATGEELVRQFQEEEEGDTVEAVVLAVDPEARAHFAPASSSSSRIRSVSTWRPIARGSIINGTVKEVDAKGATVELADGDGGLRARFRHLQGAYRRRFAAPEGWRQGQKAKFIGMDRKGRVLQLSIRAKDDDEMQQALEDYQSVSGGTTKLGALLKEQMNKSE